MLIEKSVNLSTNMNVEEIMKAAYELEELIDSGVIDQDNFPMDKLVSLINVVDMANATTFLSGEYYIDKNETAALDLKNKFSKLAKDFYTARKVIKTIPFSLSNTGQLQISFDLENVIDYNIFGRYETYNTNEKVVVNSFYDNGVLMVKMVVGENGSDDVANFNGVVEVLMEDYSQ